MPGRAGATRARTPPLTACPPLRGPAPPKAPSEGPSSSCCPDASACWLKLSGCSQGWLLSSGFWILPLAARAAPAPCHPGRPKNRKRRWLCQSPQPQQAPSFLPQGWEDTRARGAGPSGLNAPRVANCLRKTQSLLLLPHQSSSHPSMESKREAGHSWRYFCSWTSSALRPWRGRCLVSQGRPRIVFPSSGHIASPVASLERQCFALGNCRFSKSCV